MRQSQDASQDVDLNQSIPTLSRLATGKLELNDLLTQVAGYAGSPLHRTSGPATKYGRKYLT